MHLFNLRILQQFVCVAEHESISRAASILHISASPLSRAIINFESEIGFPLFDRVGKSLRLNSAGRELLANARSLIHSNERLLHDINRWAGGTGGTVVIGHMPGALYNGVLPSAAREVQATHPTIRFQFEGALESDQMDLLRRGKIDFSVQTQEVFDLDLSSEIYATERYVLLLPKSHRLAEQESIGLEHLIGAEWVVTPERTGLRSRFMAACRSVGFEPRVGCVAGDIVSALALVANGFGLCVAQEGLLQFCGSGIEVRPLPLLRMQTDFRIVWRPAALTPAATRFLATLRTKATRQETLADLPVDRIPSIAAFPAEEKEARASNAD